jgi:hypothetical protein
VLRPCCCWAFSLSDAKVEALNTMTMLLLGILALYCSHQRHYYGLQHDGFVT